MRERDFIETGSDFKLTLLNDDVPFEKVLDLMKGSVGTRGTESRHVVFGNPLPKVAFENCGTHGIRYTIEGKFSDPEDFLKLLSQKR